MRQAFCLKTVQFQQKKPTHTYIAMTFAQKKHDYYMQAASLLAKCQITQQNWYRIFTVR